MQEMEDRLIELEAMQKVLQEGTGLAISNQFPKTYVHFLP